MPTTECEGLAYVLVSIGWWHDIVWCGWWWCGGVTKAMQRIRNLQPCWKLLLHPIKWRPLQDELHIIRVLTPFCEYLENKKPLEFVHGSLNDVLRLGRRTYIHSPRLHYTANCLLLYQKQTHLWLLPSLPASSPQAFPVHSTHLTESWRLWTSMFGIFAFHTHPL
jgi:hypothetical protein